MICKRCNTENPDDARSCRNCDLSFDEADSANKGKQCPNCNRLNKPDARFCAKCGADLTLPHRAKKPQYPAHSSKQQTNIKSRKNPFFDRVLRKNPVVVTLMIIGGILVFVSILYVIRESQMPDTVQLTEQKTDDPVLEARVLQVASKFICSCGTCGEKPLDVCACNKAVEERQAIRNYLQAGQSDDQVIAAINSMFGWIKPQFASQYVLKESGSADTSKHAVPEQVAGSSSMNPKQLLQEKIATVAERTEIFSHFKCPCGQCGMDELKDCTCDHPRGAKEVKAFVDEKISVGKLTVAQIVNEVDKIYGAKKY